MKKFERLLIGSMRAIIDGAVAILAFAFIYTREWFPHEVLSMELRLARASARLDIIGGLTLIACMMAWHYVEYFLAKDVVLWAIGIFHWTSERLHELFGNRDEA